MPNVVEIDSPLLNALDELTRLGIADEATIARVAFGLTSASRVIVFFADETDNMRRGVGQDGSEEFLLPRSAPEIARWYVGESEADGLVPYYGIADGAWISIRLEVGRVYGALVFEGLEVPPDTHTQRTLRAFASTIALRLALGEQIAHAVKTAKTDPMTGLAVRDVAIETLDRLIANREPATMVVVDLDGLKRVNDTEGHAAGDRMIRAAASALRAVCREGDVVARYGGDEFVLVFRGRIGPTMMARIGLQFEKAGLRGSRGYAHIPDHAMTSLDAFTYADAQMYEMKRASRATTTL